MRRNEDGTMKRKIEEDEDAKKRKKTRFSIDDLLEDKTKETSIISTQDNSLPHVDCRLEGKDLWAKFYDLGTEMIITKSGRRMFPTVKVAVNVNDHNALFYVFLDVVPVDEKRYRYIYNKSSWLTAGKAEPAPSSSLYMHPDSPFNYDQLHKQVISFEKAKLTNNDVEKTNHLILNSMHKYQPRVHVVRRNNDDPIEDPLKVDLKTESYRTFVFPETQFMAVTAYQNQLITKLKIEKNPFAKGFRDPSGRDCEYQGDTRLDSRPLPPLYNPLLQQALITQYWLGKNQPSLLSRFFFSPLSLTQPSSSVIEDSQSVSPSIPIPPLPIPPLPKTPS